MDFTLTSFEQLLFKLKKNKEYQFISFEEYLESNVNSVSIIRHDVDLIPENSLKTAQIENELGIKGSYYFRIIPESFDVGVIEKIAGLGHEIGYHYEDVDLVSQRSEGRGQKSEELIDWAYESFCVNLEKFRKIYPVKTICMHGSPRSKYDNKMIWTKYSYRDLGIIGEPYFDIDWNEFGYLTDTGRRWNGNNVSVRDKVNSRYSFNFRTTDDIINNIDSLPDKMMFTVHPQRWNDYPVKWSDFLFHGGEAFPWIKELVLQNVKNLVKRVVVKGSEV